MIRLMLALWLTLLTASFAFGDDDTPTLGVGAAPTADAVPLISERGNLAFKPVKEPKLAGGKPDKPIGTVDHVAFGKGANPTSETVMLLGDCRLHVEWYAPPGGAGQLAGNSGVFLGGLYEVQVLGTKPGPNPPKKNEAGAIYSIKAADVNASTGPGTWQAYDIFFRAPRYKAGKKTENARMSVYWNGKLVHDNVEAPRSTYGPKKKENPRGDEGVALGPVVLQSHASMAKGPVRFRNVWVAPLEARTYTPGEWTRPFNGENLDGWTPVGGKATYRVEGGVIVGTTAPNTPNTFLVLRQALRDFELVAEVKQHAELNSGIQVRSNVDGGLDNRTGRLRGYQVEMDGSRRAYTGAVYDEGRRGWLLRLPEAHGDRTAYKVGEWNTIRIVAQGPVIRTWVNGKPAASVMDAVDRSGHIGLQVHGVGKRTDPLEVRWRNIRLREWRPAGP